MEFPIFIIILVIVFFIVLAQKSKKQYKENIESEKRAMVWYISEVKKHASSMPVEKFAREYGYVYLNFPSNKENIDEALFGLDDFRESFIKIAVQIEENNKKRDEIYKKRKNEFYNQELNRKQVLQDKADLLISNSDLNEWTKNKNDYQKLYLHPKWKSYRDLALEYHGKQCIYCSQKTELQIHHPTYRGGAPWHYKLKEVEVVCKKCHWKSHKGYLYD
jgi:hypothetical protein